MGFYLRKSVKVGPLRFNLSQSGIGVSAGITGFRVSSGPRGNYVHMGRHGLYYRASLPSSAQPSRTAGRADRKPVALPRSPQHFDGVVEIESGSVDAMADSSSATLLAEIREKHGLWRRWPVALFLGVPGWCLLGLFALAGHLPAFLAIVLAPALVLGVVWLARLDKLRKTVVLMYAFDAETEGAYRDLHDGFDALAGAQHAWHWEARKAVVDRKREAGAASLVKLHRVRLRKMNPPGLATNIDVPSVPVGRQTLYLFPDRVLIFDGRAVGAVGYEQLNLTVTTSRFVEADTVPADSEVVGSTWQYVNKGGGPDRRFGNNRQLPIMLYGQIHFESATGLNEIIQVSNPKTAEQFGSGVRSLATALATAARQESLVPGASTSTQPPRMTSTARVSQPAAAPPPTIPGDISADPGGRITIGPGRGFWYDVVGESNYQGTLRRADGGRLEAGAEVIVPCVVIPEPTNTFDPNALMVQIEGFGKVGYFARDDSRFKPLRDQLLASSAVGVCEGRLTGGWDSDVHIGIRLSLRRPERILDSSLAEEGPEALEVRTASDWATRPRIALPEGRRPIPLVEEYRCQAELRRLAAGRDVEAETVVFDAVLVPDGDAGVVCAVEGAAVGRLSSSALEKFGPVLTALLRAGSVGICGGWIVKERDGLGVKLSLGTPAQLLQLIERGRAGLNGGEQDG